MKYLPAANAHAVLQNGDDFFESLAGERRSIEKQKREVAQHVARGIASEDRMSLNFSQEFLGVVAKNGMQQLRERAALGDVWTEEGGGAFAPDELCGSGVADEPAFGAQNFRNIARRESARSSRRNVWRFLPRHLEILTHVGEMA
jgi:hypothetical protein